MGFLLICFIIVMAAIFIIQKTENNRLTFENNRQRKELYLAYKRNDRLVEPLESIARQEPLTALSMLRDHLETNKQTSK